MEQQLYDEALRQEEITDELISQLKDRMEYGSISFLNDTITVLSTFRKRLQRGDEIRLQRTGERLTEKGFQDFVKSEFSSYILSEVFKNEGKPGKEKAYFKLEACEGGYNLVLGKDGKQKTYEWISSLSEKFSLVYMIATGVVYVKDVRSGRYTPFISENGKYCRYDRENGKILEIK
ncbi:MAG: hypothetical protein MR332_01890 [Fusicatenibacter sp.]|nr:hypothetical protein [Fusicatenibacter sp.]